MKTRYAVALFFIVCMNADAIEQNAAASPPPAPSTPNHYAPAHRPQHPYVTPPPARHGHRMNREASPKKDRREHEMRREHPRPHAPLHRREHHRR